MHTVAVCVAGAGLLALSAVPVFAHGASSYPVRGGLGVRVEYDNGAPMAFADVKVFAPGEMTETWQEGSTDANGAFVFLPSALGAWRVVVDDGMGHRVETLVDADALNFSASAGASGAPRIRWGDTALGLAILFALFGGYAFWRKARKSRG